VAGGATWLGVALVEEGLALRHAGISEPILVLSEPPRSAMNEVVGNHLTPTLYTPDGVAAAAKAATAREPLPVHVKINTGMNRVGASVPDSIDLAAEVAGLDELELEGVWTHFPVADEQRRDDFTNSQLAVFQATVDHLRSRGIQPKLLHASNSAGALRHEAAHFNLVRCGIALYGIPPAPGVPNVDELRPAMSLRARVSYVKEIDQGEGVSYGLLWQAPERTVIATVPLGYADGVPRRLSGADVLVNGQRRPIAGAVTMDQLMVDCGPGADVSVGDEVVLLGDGITAWDWAGRLGSIAYEVVCGISERVPRIYS
jgi:alanine racemase